MVRKNIPVEAHSIGEAAVTPSGPVVIRHTLDMRQASNILVQIHAEAAFVTDSFQMVGHAGSAIDDADIASGAIWLRARIDDMSDLWEARRLDAVFASGRCEDGVQGEAVCLAFEQGFRVE